MKGLFAPALLSAAIAAQEYDMYINEGFHEEPFHPNETYDYSDA